MSPILLILIPLGMAPLAYISRHLSPLAALLSAATTLAMIRLCLEIPLGASAQVLGRELALDPLSRSTLLFLLAVATASLSYAWPVPQGQLFPSFVLLILAPLIGAIMIRNFLIAALLLEMAAIITVFLMQGDRGGSTDKLSPRRLQVPSPDEASCPPGREKASCAQGRGDSLSTGASLGYLIVVMVATPSLLLASWLLDLYTIHPEDPTPIRYIVTLLALGFGLLLAAVPLHLWLPAIVAEAPAMVTALVVSIIEPAILFLLLSLLGSFPWLTTETQAPAIMTVGGLLTALVGGIMAFSQGDLGHLLAYSAISDLGCILVSLGIGSPSGVAVALLHVVNRSISVLLGSMSLAAIRHRLASDSFNDLGGVARRMPFTTIGLIIGGMALGGFPPFHGFASRWLIYRAAMEQDPTYAYLLILAGGSVVLGYVRAIRALFGAPKGAEIGREPWVAAVMIIALVILSLAMGLYPQLALEPILALVEGIGTGAAD